MSTPEDLSRSLGRLEGGVEGLREGQDQLRRELVEQMEAKHRENQQQNLSARETLERIERAAADRARGFDNALTAVRLDLTERIDGHEVRLDALEAVQTRTQWLRSVVERRSRPLTALFWTAAGTAVGLGLEHLLQ